MRSEVRWLQDLFVRQHRGALDRVLELACVARPALGDEPRKPLVAHGQRAPQATPDLHGEVAGQGRDVLPPLGERREVDGDHVEAIEQIHPEPARGRLPREVLGRGGEQAHVHAPGPPVADAADLALLQHAQQLRLERQRQLADLVEQQRAAVRLLEQARPVSRGARERPLHVAEQLGLEQRVGDRGAVHRDERLRPSRARPMDRLRDDLLTGAALAGDEHRGLVLRHAGDELQGLTHRPALGDEGAGRRAAVELCP